MTEAMPALFKGYTCPDLEDCSKCKLRKTDCIVYSEKGKKKLAEWKRQRKVEENK